MTNLNDYLCFSGDDLWRGRKLGVQPLWPDQGEKYIYQQVFSNLNNHNWSKFEHGTRNKESIVCKFTVCHNLTKSRNLVASSCQIQIFTIWPDFPPLHIWQQDKADRAILKSDFDRNQPLSISASEIFVNLHLCFIWFSWFSLDCSTLLCHCQKIGFRLEKEGRFAGCHLKLLTFTYLQELLVVIAIKLSEFILWDIFSTYIGIQMYKEIFT